MRGRGAVGLLVAALTVAAPARAQEGERATQAQAPASPRSASSGVAPSPVASGATPTPAADASAAPDARAAAAMHPSDTIPLGRRAPDPTARALEASIADGLLERERELRLGRGALVSAALATPVREELPAGEATADLAVDVDAAGVVRRVTVLGAPRARGAWARVAAAVAKELDRAPLAGHYGPYGSRVTLRVVLTKRYPSGHDKLVEVKGFALIFDVADFGASKRRQVRAWITRERALGAADAHALPASPDVSRSPSTRGEPDAAHADAPPPRR